MYGRPLREEAGDVLVLLAGDSMLEWLGEVVGVKGRLKNGYAGEGDTGDRIPLGVRLLRREERGLECDCARS